MKRRNVEIGKMRRPIKKNKITEGIYGSTLLYLKFLSLWALVILADFILEFRFEFLWPFYLLLRSVYDSFKYQGLAFSIFFVCIALTSDMLCFFFIPVNWLFFAASTYVWVQYVWHTDKGICAPTIVLWVLFVYLETAVRLRDIKHMPGHLDLCRPFAAHCIGYPVVTLGFGFKSYIGFRMRQRKQRDVAKENEFYMQLIQQALPPEAATPEQQQADGVATSVQSSNLSNNNSNSKSNNNNTGGNNGNLKNGHIPNGHVANGIHSSSNSNNSHGKSYRKSVDKCKNDQNDHEQNNKHSEKHDKHIDRQQKQQVNHSHSNGSTVGVGASADDAATAAVSNDRSHQTTNVVQQNGVSGADVSTTTTTTPSSVETPSGGGKQTQNAAAAAAQRRRERREQEKEREAHEHLQRLESDAKRLRNELQSSRGSEQELRLQVASLTTSEKVSKGEITSLQREVEELQQRLQNAHSSRSTDKQNLANLERRLADERRLRSQLETQLGQERKSRKQEEARAAQAAAQQNSSRDCPNDHCRSRRRELETELGEYRSAARWAEEKCKQTERDNALLAEQLRDTDILMSALSAMQEKNAHLENSLSAETRIKLDLFSALGEAKRQIEIRESDNRSQEKEIEELKSKIAQVLAVMPSVETFSPTTCSTTTSRVRLGAVSPPGNQNGGGGGGGGASPQGVSTLDPNATAYTPKGQPSEA